jgi:hypothetical protein
MKALIQEIDEKYQVAAQLRRKAPTDLERNYWFGVEMAYGDILYTLRRAKENPDPRNCESGSILSADR